MEVRRGDIWQVDFGVNKGSRQNGIRPAVIVSNNIGNKFSPTVLAMPLTSQPKKPLPTHGRIKATQVNGLDCDSTFLAEQSAPVDKDSLLFYRGKLTLEQMAEVDAALSISFGLAAIRNGRYATA